MTIARALHLLVPPITIAAALYAVLLVADAFAEQTPLREAPAAAEMADVAPGKLVWQQLDSEPFETDSWGEVAPFHMRAAVPGGWLVVSTAQSLVFIPDPSHEWDGSSPSLD